ncbi:MAG: class I SAM-dependent methyltransferase [Actinobacteria bacterium]|nr:class I SAM-dependent methyltransferase [Actinomycetota bacterium]
MSGTELKTCCAATYEQDWVAALLGDSYHPGGAALTRDLANALQLSPGMKVLDIASGTGTSALEMAARYGVHVIGIDRSPTLVAKARRRASEADLSGRVRFVVGDGEMLPLAGESVEAIVCECALCTFPDKPAGITEMARVLCPEGRVGISDVAVDRESLDQDLQTLEQWVACLGGACSITGYAQLLNNSGLHVQRTEDRREALLDLVERVEPRLKALAALGLPGLPEIDSAEVDRWMTVARDAISSGAAGYCLLVAGKPGSH